jgi:signal transduction histidine kinase
VLLKAQDNSIGIPSDEQELVFSRFYRGRKVSISSLGTRLGLPIARVITHNYGIGEWVWNLFDRRFAISPAAGEFDERRVIRSEQDFKFWMHTFTHGRKGALVVPADCNPESMTLANEC